MVLILLIAIPIAFAGLGTTQTTDQINITVTDSSNGQDSETVGITVGGEAPSGFPASAEQFNAIDNNDDSTLSPIEIAQAITENNQQGSVGGVEVSPIEFAQIITWNASE